MQIFMNIREEIFISFQSGKDFHKIERNAFWPVKRKYKIRKCFRHTSRQSYICCLWRTMAKLLPKMLKKFLKLKVGALPSEVLRAKRL